MKTYRISIEKEPDSRHEDHDPLVRLPIDRLVDLSYANIAILEFPISPCPCVSWRYICSPSHGQSLARGQLHRACPAIFESCSAEICPCRQARSCPDQGFIVRSIIFGYHEDGRSSCSARLQVPKKEKRGNRLRQGRGSSHRSSNGAAFCFCTIVGFGGSCTPQ